MTFLKKFPSASHMESHMDWHKYQIYLNDIIRLQFQQCRFIHQKKSNRNFLKTRMNIYILRSTIQMIRFSFYTLCCFFNGTHGYMANQALGSFFLRLFSMLTSNSIVLETLYAHHRTRTKSNVLIQVSQQKQTTFHSKYI